MAILPGAEPWSAVGDPLGALVLHGFAPTIFAGTLDFARQHAGTDVRRPG